jgi:hypothetical protein
MFLTLSVKTWKAVNNLLPLLVFRLLRRPSSFDLRVLVGIASASTLGPAWAYPGHDGILPGSRWRNFGCVGVGMTDPGIGEDAESVVVSSPAPALLSSELVRYTKCSAMQSHAHPVGLMLTLDPLACDFARDSYRQGISLVTERRNHYLYHGEV